MRPCAATTASPAALRDGARSFRLPLLVLLLGLPLPLLMLVARFGDAAGAAAGAAAGGVPSSAAGGAADGADVGAGLTGGAPPASSRGVWLCCSCCIVVRSCRVYLPGDGPLALPPTSRLAAGAGAAAAAVAVAVAVAVAAQGQQQNSNSGNYSSGSGNDSGNAPRSIIRYKQH